MGYDNFRKSEMYSFHSVKKGESIDKYYDKIDDLSEKFKFPTYKNKAYFGIQF